MDVPWELINQHLICRNALMVILGIGIRVWNTCKDIMKHGFKSHGMIGQKNSLNEVIHEDISLLMEEIQQFAEPIAASYVRDTLLQHKSAAGSNIDPDAVYLPPHWSKRGLYARYCFERGWKIMLHQPQTIITKELCDDSEWTQKKIYQRK
jgi:hypothetical protein